MAELVHVNTLFGIFLYSQETLTQLIHLQTAAKKRIAEIKDCETKIEKAFNYFAEVFSTGLMYMTFCVVSLLHRIRNQLSGTKVLYTYH